MLSADLRTALMSGESVVEGEDPVCLSQSQTSHNDRHQGQVIRRMTSLRASNPSFNKSKIDFSFTKSSVYIYKSSTLTIIILNH